MQMHARSITMRYRWAHAARTAVTMDVGWARV